MTGLKDDRLDALAETGNVAQFASFGPGEVPALRHLRVLPAPASLPQDLEAAIGLVLAGSAGTVNVRSFLPDRDKGCPFHYGLTTVAEAAALVRSLAAQGYFTIVNETIDVHDGGVSGVSLGGLVEFAPDDTPRAVEQPGTAALSHDLATRLLTAVYGFAPALDTAPDQRLEFSLHPKRVGYRRSHTLCWETEQVQPVVLSAPVLWPNRFSRHIGDKAYGLLIADLLGVAVPRTTVVSRRVAPFTFGRSTGTAEHWTRTCPTEQAPGTYTTVAYWTDPFALLQTEDPDGLHLASVLAQEAVDAQWSGATIASADEHPDHIEGVSGSGEAFMLGERAPEVVPAGIREDVLQLSAALAATLGPVRIEWAHDGDTAWALQVHVARHFFAGRSVLSAGDASTWLDFTATDGLENLRDLIARAQQDHAGIRIHGQVGLTSHVGDLLRRAGVPAVLADLT